MGCEGGVGLYGMVWPPSCRHHHHSCRPPIEVDGTHTLLRRQDFRSPNFPTITQLSKKLLKLMVRVVKKTPRQRGTQVLRKNKRKTAPIHQPVQYHTVSILQQLHSHMLTVIVRGVSYILYHTGLRYPPCYRISLETSRNVRVRDTSPNRHMITLYSMSTLNTSRLQSVVCVLSKPALQTGTSLEFRSPVCLKDCTEDDCRPNHLSVNTHHTQTRRPTASKGRQRQQPCYLMKYVIRL